MGLRAGRKGPRAGLAERLCILAPGAGMARIVSSLSLVRRAKGQRIWFNRTLVLSILNRAISREA